jgi:hypothetical protein
LAPLFEGLESDKHRNLKALEELVLTATEFIYNIDTESSLFEEEVIVAICCIVLRIKFIIFGY